MRRPRTSMLHLPADPPAWVDFQAVPHGVVHLHTYRSRPLGLVRKLRVYTPPGYAAGVAAGRRYPTLYLQHGMGDNQATWVVHGKAHWILDNLIARHQAVPKNRALLNHSHPGAPCGKRGTGFPGASLALNPASFFSILPEWFLHRRKGPARRSRGGNHGLSFSYSAVSFWR